MEYYLDFGDVLLIFGLVTSGIILGIGISASFEWFNSTPYDGCMRDTPDIQPADYIKLEDLYVTNKSFCIMDDFDYSTVSATGSMRSTISDNSILIEDPNFRWQDLRVGDIVSFETHKNNTNSNIVHRIIGMGYDKEKNKPFFVTKGDNVVSNDGISVYPEDITYLIVGVLY